MKHFLIIGLLFCLTACSQKQTGQLIYSSNASGQHNNVKRKSVQPKRSYPKIAPIEYQHWISQPSHKAQVNRYQTFLKNAHLEMDNQCSTLKLAIEACLATQSQRDDITILAIKA